MRKIVFLLAIVAVLCVLSGTASATDVIVGGSSQIVTPHFDGSVTVTDFSTGLQFRQFPAVGFRYRASYYATDPLFVPFAAPAPIVTTPRAVIIEPRVFFRRSVIVDPVFGPRVIIR